VSDSDDFADGATPSPPITDTGFRPLLEKLSATYHFDFREYKEISLARRIRTRMAQVRVDDFEAYARYLDAHPDEHVALFNTILINVTGFFRDPEAWRVLAAEVIPNVVAEAASSRSIRLWSAGCSSGEEVYSLAMLLAEHLGGEAVGYAIKIYGTDVDEDALGAARHAAYRAEHLKEVPDTLLDRYFTRDGHLNRVRRDLRRWCIFGHHNLTQAPPLSHIDLLVCRNVLIYFQSDLQERVLARFHYAIRDGGYLFLGRSESLLARSRMFTPVHLKWRIFRRAAAAGRQATAVLPDPGLPAAVPGAPAVRAEAPGGASRVQRALEVLPAAVLVVDMTDTVLTWNTAAERLFDTPAAGAVGRKFRDLDISYRIEGLRARLEEVKAHHTTARLEDAVFSRRNGDLVQADIWVIPLVDGPRPLGVVVSATEATEYVRLKEQTSRIAEQHATAIEELQSTNEELETTNEELQSTNEELETTNEELQSTNEELETTVEELQATNTELGTLNTELESRTAELNRLDREHRALLDSLEPGVIVLDRAGTVLSWNHAAERLWGLRREQAVGRDFFALPVESAAARGPFQRVLETGATLDAGSVSYTLPGGETRRAALRLSPLRDGSAEVTGAVGLLWPASG
jgi:two-component system CheB/CheR fusion protein